MTRVKTGETLQQPGARITRVLFDLEMTQAPSIETGCRSSGNDANRALVWLIRWRALKSLCARPDVAEWRRAGARTSRAMCEVAAAFDLNDGWEFDHQRASAMRSIGLIDRGVRPF
jgi:hypothetical protein